MTKRAGLIFMLLLSFAFGSSIAYANADQDAVAPHVGLADDDGHGEETDDHADDEDGHGHDDAADHHGEDDAHADADDHHADDADYAGHDDHHGGPFTWASLMPLFAGLGVAAVVSGSGWGMFKHALSGTQLGVIALTLVTGTLHLILGLAGERLLLLNGIGYFGLLGLLYLPLSLSSSLKNVIRIVLAVYTLVTIAGYFYLHSVAQFDTLAILSKGIEALLVIVLAMRIGQVQNVGDGA